MVKNGLDIQPLSTPLQQISAANAVSHIAFTYQDFPNLQPEFNVKPGQMVKSGEILFTDRNHPEIRFITPVSGIVEEVETGPRRTLKLVSLKMKTAVAASVDKYVKQVGRPLKRHAMQELLLKSGLWTAFVARPFSEIPLPYSVPSAILVTAIDTRPLAADPRVVLANDMTAFQAGIEGLVQLTDGKVFVCQSNGQPLIDEALPQIENIEFSGVHPAGLAGTHIHYLCPLKEDAMVWVINYQEAAAIGELLLQGTLRTQRVVALAGTGIDQPRLVSTFQGAKIAQLIDREVVPGGIAVYSGSPLSVKHSQWLGRRDYQVTALRLRDHRPDWQEKLMHLFRGNGSLIGDTWMLKASPIVTHSLPLLRALIVGDCEQAKKLGCLALDPEDMELFDWLSPNNQHFGRRLTHCLQQLAH